jgi:hypothetical protein
MSDGIYQPNNLGRVWKIPIPDEIEGSKILKRLPSGELFSFGRIKLRPNDPSDGLMCVDDIGHPISCNAVDCGHERVPLPLVEDRRPQVLYSGEEFTPEYWEKRLAENQVKGNGRG